MTCMSDVSEESFASYVSGCLMCLLWPSISPHSLTSDTTDTNNVIVRARAPDSEGSPQNSAPAIFRGHYAREDTPAICCATTRGGAA